jgi:hypothetical protein
LCSVQRDGENAYDQAEREQPDMLLKGGHRLFSTKICWSIMRRQSE